MQKILVCDDEEDIVSAVSIYLKAEGYEVVCAYNGREALELAAEENFSLILLDIMMPELDGIAAMTELRRNSNVPIILLTAKGEDADKILGLNLGADDYIAKPFHPAELVARVKAQLRRFLYLGSRADKPKILRCGGLELDPDTRRVSLDGEELSVTPTEFAILRQFMEEPGTVFSTTELYAKALHGGPASGQLTGVENNIAVHIRHLREKIEIDPANPRYLKVVWGRGYKIEKQK